MCEFMCMVFQSLLFMLLSVKSGHLLSLLEDDECVHNNGFIAPLIWATALLVPVVSLPLPNVLLFERLLLYLCNYQMYMHYSGKDKLVTAVLLLSQISVTQVGIALIVD